MDPGGEPGNNARRKNYEKRLLALLLCLVMVIGLVPTVFAAEGEVNVKICYLGGGSDYTKSYAQGETVEKPADPNKPGYTWNGNGI